MINKKNVSLKIAPAIEAVQKYLLTSGKVPGEYDGYAASLGAAIVTSGFLPALAFYTDKERKKDRHKILMAVHHINSMVNKGRYLTAITPDSLKKIALVHHVLETDIRNEVVEAVVALKLALRNFPHDDD